MDNQNDLRFLSVKLYPYFSDVVVGSEKVVKYRRYFYKCMDNCLSQRDIRFISGSRAEGLDLPGSDLDLMCLTDTYVVDENKGIHRSILEKLNGDCVCFGTTKTLNIDFKTLCKIHGPAVSTALNGIQEVDFVRCLPCREWPSIAKRWLHRSRCFKWPSSDLITEAIHEGVLLVPVGSKSPSSEENNTEWRFSFSLTEKLLVHSFNHTQLLCYALLKIVLKEIFNKVNIFENCYAHIT
ncbi:unnamed protein product [Mytilus edulis]|uniref:Polymerase nucleotidyl transferase domain-containing protein n=1 Tax=Mytilus edulis TaxID=6550 RepID=A0A8S3TWA6_MYTED|nr:unnamed protein product [Mytilus edulis]